MATSAAQNLMIDTNKI